MSQTMMPPGGAPPPPDPAPPAPTGDNVLVTICSDGQGGFTVFAGDEPEEAESGDMSSDDVAAMGPAGDTAAPKGQPADSVETALKITMGILQSAATNAPGGAQDAFAAGFGQGGGNSAPPEIMTKPGMGM